MKKINNILKLVLFCGLAFLASCETTDLDLTENPNALPENQGSVDFFMNAVQEDFARFVEGFGLTGAQVSRIDYMSGRDYTNAYSPAGFDARWRSAYQGMMKDLREMNALASEAGQNHHIAMGQVMQAYVIMTLVDFFGDVPYTEAIAGAENLNPVRDAGADVYAAAIGLLDSAKATFDGPTSQDPEYDLFYNKNWSNWSKLCNTLKLKAYMTTRLVDGSALASFDAIITSGDYITSNAEDFQFTWGKNEINPDTRHPRYAASYTSTGGGRYMSNFMMDYMRGDGYFGPNFDPRIMFYYYRQSSSTPGIDAPADEETLECGLITPPLHYAGYAYCGVENGWWGRDHGNDNGIPPDGFLRALAGVYPAGGTLDDWSYDSQVNGDGHGGNGITPIMLASWVDFMIAERAMLSGGAGEAAAKTAMMAGVDKSFDKVINFKPLTDRFTAIVDGNFTNLTTWINDFKSDLDSGWDAAGDKMEVLAMQYFVALRGNGIDGYNFYRRTGYPHGLQPNIEPNPGGFIRSFFYPASHTNTNSNAPQKSGVDVQVFWDNNGPSPGFPIAN